MRGGKKERRNGVREGGRKRGVRKDKRDEKMFVL